MAVRVLVSFSGFTLQNRDIERLEYTQELAHHDRARLVFYRDTSSDVTIDEIAGQDCRVQIWDDDVGDAASNVDFDGVAVDAAQSYQLNGGSQWTVELRSRTVFLERDRNFRVFPELDVAGLAAQVAPGTRVEGNVSPTPREDYVQWGETDWDFLLRAADEAGAFVRVVDGGVELRRGFEQGGPELVWGRDLLAVAVRAAPRNAGV